MNSPSENLLVQLLGPAEERCAVRRKRGSLLFSRDESRNYFYIESGCVRVTKPLPDGRDLLIGIRVAGELCGAGQLLRDKGPDVTGVMLADGEVHALPDSRVHQVCEQSSEIWHWLAGLHSRRAAELERRVEMLA